MNGDMKAIYESNTTAVGIWYSKMHTAAVYKEWITQPWDERCQ